MDTIIISDLEVFYQIGTTDQERAKPQRLLISLELEHEFKSAIASDNLGLTIDYYSVCQRLLGFGETCQWQLIETLAYDIGEMVLKEFKPKAVTVKVKKFVIPQAQFVAVSLTRTR